MQLVFSDYQFLSSLSYEYLIGIFCWCWSHIYSLLYQVAVNRRWRHRWRKKNKKSSLPYCRMRWRSSTNRVWLEMPWQLRFSTDRRLLSSNRPSSIWPSQNRRISYRFYYCSLAGVSTDRMSFNLIREKRKKEEIVRFLFSTHQFIQQFWKFIKRTEDVEKKLYAVKFIERHFLNTEDANF